MQKQLESGWQSIKTAPMKKDILLAAKSKSGGYPEDWDIDIAQRLSETMFLGRRYLYAVDIHNLYWMPLQEFPNAD